ncbi:sulfatase-like hydrolase/transferase [Streptococcus hongkongensis]|nr:hypothetical protein NC01_04430 [Streptococcus uberis]
MKKIDTNKILISTLIKYSFTVILLLMVLFSTSNSKVFYIGLIELGLIFIISELILAVNFYIANILNVILLFLFNIELIIQILGRTYLTSNMLSNLDSLEALKGHAVLYVFSALITIVFSLLPVGKYCQKFKYLILTFFLLLSLEIGMIVNKKVDTTPLLNYYSISNNYFKRFVMLERIKKHDIVSVNEEFRNLDITNAINKPEELSEKPNIILIFTEGLSESILHDKRNLMTNLAKYEKNSISFSNYYNHTFATYLGIRGQLYSGYQATNYEKNKLISLQDILANQNYDTTFLNTEPNNKDFTNYLNGMNFRNVISPNNVSSTVSDKNAYEFLFQTIEKKSNQSNPFFISMYTFGTHLSLDSEDEHFKDGKSAILNKFYNLDIQFNNFMNKFNNSRISDNTILIFTTDHATYVDNDYIKAFGADRLVGNLDKVPFFIYYKGVKPEVRDVNGRNSLSLVPTILDFVDISEENYFLGDSLFNTQSKSKLDTVFSSEGTFYSTKNSKIDVLNQNDKIKVSNLIEKYYHLKLKNSK